MALSNTAIYGDTGNGKSSILESALDWLIATYGPGTVARLYTWEDYSTIEHRVECGDLQVWRVNTWDNPFEALKNAANGYFPEDPDNPKSKLIPPTLDTFKKVRGGFYEGLSTAAAHLMRALAAKAGAGVRIGPGTRPGEDAISFKDGGQGVGGNSQTHYNITQLEVAGAVDLSKKHPWHLIWTAHETNAKDERTLRPIVGPEIVGQAATPHVQRWFGGVLHAHIIPVKKEGKITLEYRLYMKQHYDDTMPNTPFKAVIRLPLKAQEKLAKEIPEFFPTSSHVFSDYMGLLEKLRGKVRDMREKGEI